MKVEIIFKTTGAQVWEVDDHYEKGSFYCLQLHDGTIRKFPTQNISSVSHLHRAHVGTRRKDAR